MCAAWDGTVSEVWQQQVRRACRQRGHGRDAAAAQIPKVQWCVLGGPTLVWMAMALPVWCVECRESGRHWPKVAALPLGGHGCWRRGCASSGGPDPSRDLDRCAGRGVMELLEFVLGSV